MRGAGRRRRAGRRGGCGGGGRDNGVWGGENNTHTLERASRGAPGWRGAGGRGLPERMCWGLGSQFLFMTLVQDQKGVTRNAMVSIREGCK